MQGSCLGVVDGGLRLACLANHQTEPNQPHGEETEDDWDESVSTNAGHQRRKEERGQKHADENGQKNQVKVLFSYDCPHGFAYRANHVIGREDAEEPAKTPAHCRTLARLK